MSRTNVERWIAGIVALLAFAACNSGHQVEEVEGETLPYRPLVFPGEARLGATVAMVIDASTLDFVSTVDNFTFTKDRIELKLEDESNDSYALNVRSVFTLEQGRSVGRVNTDPHTWFTVALFDLPDQLNNSFYPQHGLLKLSVDSGQGMVPVGSMEGIVWIIGAGGNPTSLGSGGLLPNLETAFEPTTAIRLRALEPAEGWAGFDTNWSIGGIQLTLVYDDTCFINPRVHAQADAMGAATLLGPGSPADLFVSSPSGFSLDLPGRPPGAVGVGKGPIIDIAFDRATGTGCDAPLDTFTFDLNDLIVKGVNGHTLLGPVDGNEAFDIYLLDPM